MKFSSRLFGIFEKRKVEGGLKPPSFWVTMSLIRVDITNITLSYYT